MSFLRRGAMRCMSVGRVAALASGCAMAGQPVCRGNPAPSRLIGRCLNSPDVRAAEEQGSL